MLALCLSLFFAPPALGQGRLASLLGDGSVALASPSGELLISINADAALVPASILKIPLSQAALEELGEDFRFTTEFYRNSGGDLLIRGLGDPFLVSEEVTQIAAKLRESGLTSIRRLLLDDSAFESDPDLPLEAGARDPYAARVSALAVNFNTVNLAWDEQGELVSGEAQTPLTPLAEELAAQLVPGQDERINLGSDPKAGLRQVQEVFRLLLAEAGIVVNDPTFIRQPVDDGWQLFYRHRSSRSLPDILRGMLRYSNNFIANQLFLTLGAQRSGYPATVAKSRAVLAKRLQALYGQGFGDDPNSLLMEEGSGLSRRQRASAAGFLHILERFRPHAQLLPEYGNVLRKSGTLTGVYNYAGYIQGADGLYPFVILTNQSANNRDEVLRLLQDAL